MNDIIDEIVAMYKLKVEAYETINLQDDVSDIHQELSEFEIDDLDFQATGPGVITGLLAFSF